MSKVEEDSVRSKMESLRLSCDAEISINQEKMDSFTTSFSLSMDSIKEKAKKTVQSQEQLAKMKADLRDAEDEFVKILSVKTRKEAKQMATRDSISAAKARIDELKKTVEVHRARRDEYVAIISKQSLALATSEEKIKQDLEHKGEIQEAISWYNRVLSFHIEGGHGVKFTFRNVSMKNPNDEYCFTIRHADDTYTLLDCDPPLNSIKESIQELNRMNGLFKFVRIMREKFEEVAALDSSAISVSAPDFSVSTDRSETPAKKKEHHIHHGEVNRQSDKVVYGKGIKQTLASPRSASSLRRSPRLRKHLTEDMEG